MTSSGFQRGPEPLFAIIQRLGMAGNLKICLDAADALSYGGSGETWSDRSAQGNHFAMGATTTPAEGSEPTFTGTAGTNYRSTYMNYDGGDYNRLIATNPAEVENLHKDNALFTMFAAVYLPTLPAVRAGLFGTGNSNKSNIGLDWYIISTGKQRIRCANGSGDWARQVTSGTALDTSAWNVISVSADEANDLATWMANGVVTTGPFSYTSPSGSAATFKASVGSLGNANTPLENNTRLGVFALWEGEAKSNSELLALRSVIGQRYGI